MTKKLKKNVMRLGILLVVAGVVVSGIVANMVADNLVYQNRGNDTVKNSMKQLRLWGYDYKKFEEKHVQRNFFIEDDHKYEIPVYILGNIELKDKDTVLLIHGLGGDYVSIYPQAEMYLEMGYNVLAIDQRASGKSGDEKLSFGYYEKEDIRNVVEYIKENTSGRKILIHGFSLGGVTAGLYAGTEHASMNVDAVILDSAFDSFKSVFLSVWDDMNTGIPKGYAVFCGNIGLKLKYGFDLNQIDMSKEIARATIPVFVIQGIKDEVSTIEMGEAIYNAIASGNKKMWQVDSEHIKGYFDFPMAYKKKVMEFIDEVTVVSKESN